MLRVKLLACVIVAYPRYFRKRKAEDEPDTATKKVKTEEEETMRKQNKTLFKHRDALSKALAKKHMSLILEDNNQYIPKGESKVSSWSIVFILARTEKNVFCIIAHQHSFFLSFNMDLYLLLQ